MFPSTLGTFSRWRSQTKVWKKEEKCILTMLSKYETWMDAFFKTVHENRGHGISSVQNKKMSFDKNQQKLDQVYCVWLIKRVVKRKIIQLAQLRYEMINYKGIPVTWLYWLILGGTVSFLVGSAWYLVVQGQLRLLSFYACMFWKKVEIWSGVTDYVSHVSQLPTDNKTYSLDIRQKFKVEDESRNARYPFISWQ